MFKRLKISDWRQFSNVDISFHPHLTVLTGANGAGKTTILNLLSQSTGWDPQFVSSYEKDKAGISKYFNSLKNIGKRFFIKASNTPNAVENKLGELEFSDGTIADLILPQNVSSGTYSITTKGGKKEKGVYISSHRPSFPYRAVKTIPTSVATREQIFKKYDDFNRKFVFDTYRDSDKLSATALIKETIASLAIFGYGNQSVVANENAKKLFEGYADILKIVLPPKLGFEGISVIVPEVMLCTKTGNFPIDAVSGGISSIIDITWQLYMFADTSESFVAIIDEPENHLHPELQRNFLGNLIKAFPNVQFIVATHNPFMIPSVQACTTIRIIKIRKSMLSLNCLTANGARLRSNWEPTRSTLPPPTCWRSKGRFQKILRESHRPCSAYYAAWQTLHISGRTEFL